MSGLTFDHGIIAFMTALGFALIALGGRAAARRQFFQGLFGVGAGALLLLTMALRIYPALMSPTARLEREELQQTVARARNEIAVLTVERDRATERATAAIAESKRVEQRHSEAITSIAKEVADTVTKYAEPNSPLQVVRPNRAGPPTTEHLLDDLKALRFARVVRAPDQVQVPAPVVQMPPPAAPQPAGPAQPALQPLAPIQPVGQGPAVNPAPPSPSASPTQAPTSAQLQPQQPPLSPPITSATTVDQLKAYLTQRHEAKAFRIAPLGETELVVGQRGSYYTIDIKDLDTGGEFRFDSARYTLTNGPDRFRASLSEFMSQVIGGIEGRHPYQLYVRGAADRLGYKGKFEPGFEYRELQVLKATSGNRYTAEPQTSRIEEPIRNRDLPDLRGAYLQAVVGQAFPKAVPEILEGLISSRREISRRNLELVLFIGW